MKHPQRVIVSNARPARLAGRRELGMRRRVPKLGARAKLCVERDRASDRRSLGKAHARLDALARRHASVPLGRSSLKQPQPYPRIVLCVPNGLDDAVRLDLGGRCTGDDRAMCHTQAACERQQGEGRDPKPRSELATPPRQQEGTRERATDQEGPLVGRPLRTDEQPDDPGSCDPRKHASESSKRRALRPSAQKAATEARHGWRPPADEPTSAWISCRRRWRPSGPRRR